MDKSTILQAFNNHFFEFIDDVQSVFPEDTDIMAAKTALVAMRKMNPRLLPKIWYEYVVLKYDDNIQAGDISFFLNKDYSEDLADMGSSANTIVSKINILREPIKNMGKENQDKSMKYIKNLNKLAKLYN
jgi:AAA15 family ATPase/GTPase